MVTRGRFEDPRDPSIPESFRPSTTPTPAALASSPVAAARPEHPGARAEADPPRRTRFVMARGSLAEAACAAAVVVLAILGLSGVGVPTIAHAGVVVLGAALIFQASAFTARFKQLEAEVRRRGFEDELESGASAELLGGATGLVLGVLALLGVAPAILGPAAVIVFGAAVLLGGGATHRGAELARLGRLARRDQTGEGLALATDAGAGAEALGGLAAVILGVLALVGLPSLTLVLVGLLALALVELVSGGALGALLLRSARA